LHGGNLGQVVKVIHLVAGRRSGRPTANEEAAVPQGLEEYAAAPEEDVPVGLGSPVAAGPGVIRYPLAGEPEPEQEVAVRVLHVPAHQPELKVKDAAKL
jgi:hypothetical protein